MNFIVNGLYLNPTSGVPVVLIKQSSLRTIAALLVCVIIRDELILSYEVVKGSVAIRWSVSSSVLRLLHCLFIIMLKHQKGSPLAKPKQH